MRGPVATGREWGGTALAAVTAVVYGIGGCGLVVSTVFYTVGKNPRPVLGALSVVALAFVAVALVRRRSFTTLEAEAMLVVLLAALVWLTVHSHIDVAAFGNGTALPLIGIYTGWFLSRRGSLALVLGVVGWVLAVAARGEGLLTSMAVLIGVETLVAAEVTRLLIGRVLRLLRTDALTGVLNRLGVEDAGRRLVAVAARRHRPLSLAVLDLDDLRVANNTHGHAAGDALLARAAATWRTRLPDAVVGRTGGDEFVALLPGTTAAAAERRLRQAAASVDVRWTAGVAELEPGESFERLVERADRRMYDRKRSRTAACTNGELP